MYIIFVNCLDQLSISYLLQTADEQVVETDQPAFIVSLTPSTMPGVQS